MVAYRRPPKEVLLLSVCPARPTLVVSRVAILVSMQRENEVASGSILIHVCRHMNTRTFYNPTSLGNPWNCV